MIHRRILTILLVGLSGFIFTVPAGATKSPHRYSPKHGAKCNKAYKRVVKHRRHHKKKVFCVKRATKKHRKPSAPASSPVAPAATTPEKAKLHSHLDPSFTRDPLNPFLVTYAYSASASQEATPQLRALGVVEEPAPLPSGVLSLFSDGKLECAINVGGTATEGECPVSYQALGPHTVTTIYTSGEQSATETEVEQIDPIPTTTTLTASYADLPGGPELMEKDGLGRKHVECGYDGPEGEECSYAYRWRLGTLALAASSSPAGSPSIRCIGACPSEANTAIAQGEAPVYMELWMHKIEPEHRGVLPQAPSCEEVRQLWTQAGYHEPAHIWSYGKSTSFSIEAVTAGGGYSASSAAKQLTFSPMLPC